MLIPALLGFAGVAIGTLCTWLVARRERSGRIATTEAETLWAEATKMREELREQVQMNADAHARCEADLTVQRLAVAELERRVRELEGSP